MASLGHNESNCEALSLSIAKLNSSAISHKHECVEHAMWNNSCNLLKSLGSLLDGCWCLICSWHFQVSWRPSPISTQSCSLTWRSAATSCLIQAFILNTGAWLVKTYPKLKIIDSVHLTLWLTSCLLMANNNQGENLSSGPVWDDIAYQLRNLHTAQLKFVINK